MRAVSKWLDMQRTLSGKLWLCSFFIHMIVSILCVQQEVRAGCSRLHVQLWQPARWQHGVRQAVQPPSTGEALPSQSHFCVLHGLLHICRLALT